MFDARFWNPFFAAGGQLIQINNNKKKHVKVLLVWTDLYDNLDPEF